MQTSVNSAAAVSAATLKNWLNLDTIDELAVLDVREHGQYGEGHLFFAVSIPYSRLEGQVLQLVPRRNVRVVVYDSNEEIALKAVVRLQALGYDSVYYLEGGTKAWEQAGYTLFAGVNLPSKTFGELVEIKLGTPYIQAQELQRRQQKNDNLIVIDGRPFSEYQKMNIPGANCCPNGELALHIHKLAPDPSTTIVINCAGRTRSIIGAQTLLNLGIENPVLALENGTQGWYLNDLALEHGSTRKYQADVDTAQLPSLQNKATRLAQKMKVANIDAHTLEQWLTDLGRTTFLFDIRSAEEYAAGSLPGAIHAPGGQLVQATDLYVGVQGARIVVFDDEGVRAPVVASWLAQMGWDVAVLTEGLQAKFEFPAAPQPDLFEISVIDTQTLSMLMKQGNVVLLDVRPSMEYRKAHIKQASWAIRPRLHGWQHGLAGKEVVLIASEKMVGQLAAHELYEQSPDTPVYLHVGGPSDWNSAGLQTESTPGQPVDSDCIDYLFFVHDRHDGNKQAALQYLKWETNLLDQVDEQELKRFLAIGG